MEEEGQNICLDFSWNALESAKSACLLVVLVTLSSGVREVFKLLRMY